MPRFGADGSYGGEGATALKSFALDMRVPWPPPSPHDEVDVGELAVLLRSLREKPTPPILPGTTGAGIVHGVDISGWQPNAKIDFQELAEDGVRFAYVKASEGLSTTKSFGDHWADLRSVGILRGGYHFASFKGERKRQPQEQADAFLRALEKVDGTFGELRPALDAEWQYFGKGDAGKKAREADMGVNYRLFPARAVIDWCHEFGHRVLEVTGLLPLLYTGNSFWKYRLASTDELVAWALWQAAYRGDGHEIPIDEWPTSMTPPWEKVTVWQHTGKGRLFDGDGDGRIAYAENIDRNAYRGTEEDLVREIGLAA